MDKEINERKNDSKMIIQLVIDFNTIEPWWLINNNLIRKSIIQSDWKTAKLVNVNFGVNRENGEIIEILMKWIGIFNCEIISQCSVESIYPLNIL